MDSIKCHLKVQILQCFIYFLNNLDSVPDCLQTLLTNLFPFYLGKHVLMLLLSIHKC